MPRPTEIVQAEETAAPKSPLRRSCRIIAVSSSVPSEAKPISERRISASLENKEEEFDQAVKGKRASSVTKENGEPAKSRSRRSSASSESSIKEDEKKLPATKTKSSQLVEDTVRPVRGRRSSENVEEETKKPIRGRRNSTQEESEGEPVKKLTRSRRSSIQEDKEDGTPIKKSRPRRSSTQEEKEELPQRNTRSRRSASRDLFDDLETEVNKNIRSSSDKTDSDKESGTARITRSRRSSIDAQEEEAAAKPVKTNKAKRRNSITENAVNLAPIDEKEQENESPVKIHDHNSANLTPTKKKHDVLELSVICETSFIEETEQKGATPISSPRLKKEDPNVEEEKSTDNLLNILEGSLSKNESNLLSLKSCENRTHSPENASVRKSPRIFEKLQKCKSGEHTSHKKCSCDDESANSPTSRKIKIEKSPLQDTQLTKNIKETASDERKNSENGEKLNDAVLSDTAVQTKPNEIKTLISDGLDGSFQFHLSKSRYGSTESETDLNDSKTSESSDKENTAINMEKDTTLTEKNVLEELNTITEPGIQQISTVSRVSNVFRPKDVNYSFAEPMEVDTTVNWEEKSRMKLWKDSEGVNKTFDETSSFNLSSTYTDIPEEHLIPDIPLQKKSQIKVDKKPSEETDIVPTSERTTKLETDLVEKRNPETERAVLSEEAKSENRKVLEKSEQTTSLAATSNGESESVIQEAIALKENLKTESIVSEEANSEVELDEISHVTRKSNTQTESLVESEESKLISIASEEKNLKNEEELKTLEAIPYFARLSNLKTDNLVEKETSKSSSNINEAEETEDSVEIKKQLEGVAHTQPKTTATNEEKELTITENEQISVKNSSATELSEVDESAENDRFTENNDMSELGVTKQTTAAHIQANATTVDTEKQLIEENDEKSKNKLPVTQLSEVEQSDEDDIFIETAHVSQQKQSGAQEKTTAVHTQPNTATADEEQQLIVGNEEKSGTELSEAEQSEEDDVFGETKDMSEDYEFDIPSDQEKESVASPEPCSEDNLNNTHNKVTELVKHNGLNEIPNKVDFDRLTQGEEEETVVATSDEHFEDHTASSKGTEELPTRIRDDKPEDQGTLEEQMKVTEITTADAKCEENIASVTKEDSKYTEMESSFQDIIQDDEEKEEDLEEKLKVNKTTENACDTEDADINSEAKSPREEFTKKSKKLKRNGIASPGGENDTDEECSSVEVEESGAAKLHETSQDSTRKSKKRTRKNILDEVIEEIFDKDMDLNLKESSKKMKKLHRETTLEQIIGRQEVVRNPLSNKKLKRQLNMIANKSILSEDSAAKSPKMANREMEEIICSTVEPTKTKQSNTEIKQKQFSLDTWFGKTADQNSKEAAVEPDDTGLSLKTKNKKKKVNTEAVEDVIVLNSDASTKHKTERAGRTIKPVLLDKQDKKGSITLTSKPSLEEFASAKLDEFLERKMAEFDADEDNSDESDTTDESDTSDDDGNSFIDDMAEEGEEDTPSEDSNAIIDEGDAINTDSERSVEDDSDHDSFICDEETIDLLSGEEFDLGPDTDIKKSRILNVEDRDEDVITIKRKPKPEPKKRKSRIIKVEDSSESELEVVDLIYGKEDLPNESNTEHQHQISTEKEQSEKNPTNDATSSIRIIENINVKEIKDTVLSERINQLVDTFCTTIPQKGDLSMNLSLEYADKGSSEEQNKPKKRKSKGRKRKSVHEEEPGPSKEPKLREALAAGSKDEQSPKRRLSQTVDDSNVEKKKLKTKETKKLKRKEKKLKKKSSSVDTLDSSGSLDVPRHATFGLMNQLITDVKNRPKRTMKPSTTKEEDSNTSWHVELDVDAKPSTSAVSIKEVEEFKNKKFHPKDFRNQMLYGSSRVKRVETKELLRKKGAYN